MVRPWLQRLPLGRSRQAGLDIVGHILFEHLLTQPARATHRREKAKRRGAELVGEVERYEDSYRLCYVRGPEGIIVELAEQIG